MNDEKSLIRGATLLRGEKAAPLTGYDHTPGDCRAPGVMEYSAGKRL